MQFSSIEKATTSLQCSSHDREMHYRLQVIDYEPFFEPINVLFFVCRRNIKLRTIFFNVCHDNMFVLTFAVVLLTVLFVCALILTYLRKS